MLSRRELAVKLEQVAGFDEPRPELEQYTTTPEIAASIIHEASLRDDLGRQVVDLGSGTGMLAIGAALYGARGVCAVEMDHQAIAIAVANARHLGVRIGWVIGDVRHFPLCVDQPVTVIMNPPFGAQLTHRGADRAFLRATASIAAVSYSIHNAGSRSFIEAFVDDHDGVITHAFEVDLELPRQHDFHRVPKKQQQAEVYRIEWG